MAIVEVAFLMRYLVGIAMWCSNDSNEVQEEIHCNMGNNTNIDEMLNDAWTLDACNIHQLKYKQNVIHGDGTVMQLTIDLYSYILIYFVVF